MGFDAIGAYVVGTNVGTLVGERVGATEYGLPIMQLYCLLLSSTLNPGRVGHLMQER